MLPALMIAVALLAPQAAAAPQAPPSRVGKWLIDQQGRVVTVHGIDLVRKTAPYYPSDFGERDAAFLASEGFTAARIGFIWEAVEPRPGVYDDTYLGRIVAINNLLAAHGIRTLVDFHQDSWSRWSGIPELGGSTGDGAPRWATLGTDPSRADDDFQAFWDNKPASDGVGIQTHFVRAWQHVVRMLDAGPGSANIIGLDPFNEPYPGSGFGCQEFLGSCPAFEHGTLAGFYRTTIAALRGTGDTHVIFPESDPDMNGVTALPKFDDPRVGYNFHSYCFPLLGVGVVGVPAPPGLDAICPLQENPATATYVANADRFDAPGFLSEFGASDVDTDNARLVDLADENFWSWTYWAYYAYHPQDPANSATQGLLVDDRLPGSESNVKQAKLDALDVPWARAVAGTPLRYHYDRAADVMTLTYSTLAPAGAHPDPQAPTEVFVPRRHYPDGYAVTVDGGRVLSPPNAAILDIAADPQADGRAHDVSVTIAPAR